ncbi:MAG: hypothetical protein KBD21_00110, partial [Candidatus Pacebacteria bacterium]|nr:hypothetical protein [Candidatus Paceibacterota bacterium]
HVEKAALHRHLTDTFRLKDKFPGKPYRLLEERIGAGLLPNHNHHVLNVPHKMGFPKGEPDITFMDSCRISCGEVHTVDGPSVTVTYEPLLRVGDLLMLGSTVEKKLIRRLEADYDFDMLQPGHLVTMHWDVPCEVISVEEAARLRRHTLDAIRLANIDKR